MPDAPTTTGQLRQPEHFLSTVEAAKALGISPALVRRWADIGRLCGRKVAGHWEIEAESLDEQVRRVHQASWWRRDTLTSSQANTRRGRATRRVIDAAHAWRANPMTLGSSSSWSQPSTTEMP